jgi:putative PIN family toxin of toxin-antitoxin system
MRAVLDTNVLFSALISPSGTPNEIYRAWRAGRFELVTSHEQLDEIRRASRYPKLRAVVAHSKVGTLVNIMKRGPVVLDRVERGAYGDISDPGDVFLLAMAVQGNADYLVTGDRRAGLIEFGKAGRARILTPAVFYSDVLSRA